MSPRRTLPLLLALIAVACAALPLAPGALAAQATPPGAAAPARGSWLSDRRDFAIGDIITVVIDETTRSRAVKGQVGTDEQSRQMGLDVSPPAIGTTPLPSIDAEIGTGKRASSRQRGESQRDVQFLTEMSVRVVALGPNGLLQVKGTRNVEQDKVKQDFQLTGWVRAQDVSPRNVVASARIADAKLVYEMEGNLGKTRGGLLGKILGAVWP